MLVSSKTWLASRGIWGGILAAGAPIVASLLNVTITPEDVTGVVDGVSALVSALGGLLAIYGRIKATKRIG